MTVNEETQSVTRKQDGFFRDQIATRNFSVLPDIAEAFALIDEISAQSASCGPVLLDGDVPLALYGAGNLGRLARDHLRLVGQEIAVVVDRNAQALASDPSWEGFSLVSPEEAPLAIKTTGILAVSIVNFPFAPLQSALQEAGWARVVPFYDIAEGFRDRHPLSNGWFAEAFTPVDVEAMKRVASAWFDDVSRAHYLQFLAWRRLRTEWSFDGAEVTTGDRFFIPEILPLLSEAEDFVDAGAHDGSVLLRMVSETNGAFGSILAIEPDPQSAAALDRTIATMAPQLREKITVSQALLADGDQDVTFHDGLGYASQIASTGKVMRRAVALDSFDIAPSFMKLHLEGGELPALIGARQTLLKSRPILAVTVYHNADGIAATAQWLMDTLPAYRLLFRLHSWGGTGAVIYAIPEERYDRDA